MHHNCGAYEVEYIAVNPRIVGSSTSRCYETMFWDFGSRHNKASLAGRADDRAIALLTLDDSEKRRFPMAAVISSYAPSTCRV